MGKRGMAAGSYIRPAGAALAACVLIAGAAGLGACSSSKKPAPAGGVGAPASGSTAISATATADTRARPAAVPTAAAETRAEVELGAASDKETLSSMSCADGLLTITTSAHVVYAELPCDRALPDTNVKPFVGQPIHVRAVPSDPAKLYLDSSAAGSVEFTVGRVWVTSS